MSAVIAAVSMATIAVGGAYLQSQNAKRQADFNRDMARLNAEAAEFDAAQAKRAGISEEVRAITDMDSAMDSQTAAIAGSGVENAGTVSSLVAENNLNMVMNFYDLQQQTLAKELGYKREASNIRQQGEINYQAGRTQARNIMLSGYTQAAQIGSNSIYKGK